VGGEPTNNESPTPRAPLRFGPELTCYVGGNPTAGAWAARPNEKVRSPQWCGQMCSSVATPVPRRAARFKESSQKGSQPGLRFPPGPSMCFVRGPSRPGPPSLPARGAAAASQGRAQKVCITEWAAEAVGSRKYPRGLWTSGHMHLCGGIILCVGWQAFALIQCLE
jgi:hypothetical protein